MKKQHFFKNQFLVLLFKLYKNGEFTSIYKSFVNYDHFFYLLLLFQDFMALCHQVLTGKIFSTMYILYAIIYKPF